MPDCFGQSHGKVKHLAQPSFPVVSEIITRLTPFYARTLGEERLINYKYSILMIYDIDDEVKSVCRGMGGRLTCLFSLFSFLLIRYLF